MSDNEILSPVSENGKYTLSDDESPLGKKVPASRTPDSESEDNSTSDHNNGFGIDGEPDYKPRKDSTSSDSSEGADDMDEVSASSKSKSSEEAEPPKPKSRSASLNHSLQEKEKDASKEDTDDEKEDLPKDVPVPVARRVSAPRGVSQDDSDVEERASPAKAVDSDESEDEERASPLKHVESDDDSERASPAKEVDSDADERSSPAKRVVASDSESEEERASPAKEVEIEANEVEVRASPLKTSVHDGELTRDEWELSKRETIQITEEQNKEEENDNHQVSEDDDDHHHHQDREIRTNGGSNHHRQSDSSSEEDQEPAHEKTPSPRRSINIPSPVGDQAPSQDGERTPSPNVPKLNPDGGVTKAYIAALNNNNNNHNGDPVSKTERASKAVKDITQMYAENIAKTSTPPASPKPVARTRPAKDITQLYTGKIEQATSLTSPGVVDKLSPKKHNMSTAVDKDAIRKAYDDVRSDTSETEWAVFKFDGNSLGVTATGNDFSEFKSLFGNEDRGFGYIRIKTGDEMSKRSKFVFVTWVGPSVSVMKKAKMSTDKALMKDIIQNLSVEMQLENHAEFSHDYFKMQVDKAAGAKYGTGAWDN